MSNKLRYIALCEDEKRIPFFSQAWWLSAACGDDWDVALVEKGGEIIASMPYMVKNRYGYTILSKPKLTPNIGPWLAPSSAKYSKVLGQQKELMEGLIDQLPKYQSFSQNWHYTVTNWLPFYWKGFNQTTKYTYVIEDLQNIDLVWTNFRENIRREIRKAQNRACLRIRSDLPIEDFIELHVMTFNRQGLPLPYSLEYIRRLVKAACVRQQCKWFVAQDEEGRNHGGVLIVWDEAAAYYLMGGADPSLRNSGASSLCMWEAIKYASLVTKTFDFEGSMSEPIEKYFRGFGAVQKPYFNIVRKPSRVLRALQWLKNVRVIG